MNVFTKLMPHYTKLIPAGVLCALVGFGCLVSAEETKKMIVTPFEEVKFVPADPAQPDGAQMAVLWGDPANGPSSMLLKFKKGANPFHIHSSDYHLAIIKGSMKHWGEGEKESDAKLLGPGSYWFQPGNQAHAGSCITDECIMFVKWEGKRDGRLAETEKK